MSEPRNRQIVVNIEGTIFDVVDLASGKDNISRSSYVRNLIIADLIQRGMISERVLQKVLTG